jgi:hypothetical protein
MMGFLGVMPVWLEKLAPNTSSRSHSFMNQLAMGCRCAQHARRRAGGVGDQPLALEGGEHRRS